MFNSMFLSSFVDAITYIAVCFLIATLVIQAFLYLPIYVILSCASAGLTVLTSEILGYKV